MALTMNSRLGTRSRSVNIGLPINYAVVFRRTSMEEPTMKAPWTKDEYSVSACQCLLMPANVCYRKFDR